MIERVSEVSWETKKGGGDVERIMHVCVGQNGDCCSNKILDQ